MGRPRAEALTRIALATARARLMLGQADEIQCAMNSAEALIAMSGDREPLRAEYLGLAAWLAARTRNLRDAREYAGDPGGGAPPLCPWNS